MGSHSLLQEIFPTQGWNLGLLHCRWILYHLSHQGRPTGAKTFDYNPPFLPSASWRHLLLTSSICQYLFIHSVTIHKYPISFLWLSNKTGWLNTTRKVFFHSSGGQKSEIKVLVGPHSDFFLPLSISGTSRYYLDCKYITSTSAFICTWPSPLCLCLLFCL